MSRRLKCYRGPASSNSVRHTGRAGRAGHTQQHSVGLSHSLNGFAAHVYCAVVAIVVEEFLAHNSLNDHSAPRPVVDRVKALDQLNDEVSSARSTTLYHTTAQLSSTLAAYDGMWL